MDRSSLDRDHKQASKHRSGPFPEVDMVYVNPGMVKEYRQKIDTDSTFHRFALGRPGWGAQSIEFGHRIRVPFICFCMA